MTTEEQEFIETINNMCDRSIDLLHPCVSTFDYEPNDKKYVIKITVEVLAESVSENTKPTDKSLPVWIES